MKNFITLTIITLGCLPLLAQSEFNLVPNSSFEEIGKAKLKEPGSVYLAAPWKSVTMNPVDLYSENAKLDEYSVPENKYGEEKAKTGTNYAGVSFFGYRGKEPRTYLGTQLKEPLKAGEEYCLKFHISMSDRSKYAVNNVGMFLAMEEITEMSDANIYREPQLLSVTNTIYDKQFSWTAICGTYVAKGGEKFLVIGNFAKDEDTDQSTVRMSQGIGGRQTNDAYYYIDDVSIIPTSKLDAKDCACEKIAGGKMQVEYKSFGENSAVKTDDKKITIINSDGTKVGEKKPVKEKETEGVEKDGVVYKKMNTETEKVEEKKEIEYSPSIEVIEYEAKQFLLPESAKPQIEQIVAYLKANPEKKIEIVGHADAAEKDIKLIGKRRSALVRKALVDAGIPATRITFITKETKVKAKNNGNNSRVTFVIK